MAGELNPLAPHHLPSFIVEPGGTDVLMVIVAIVLVVGVALLGVFYFRLHALPEHMSHGRASKLQFEIVAVLALLALFTHNGMFWVAALLLAMVRIPDFETPVNVMARSLSRMSGRTPKVKPPVDPAPPVVVADPEPAAAPAQPEAEK